MRCWTRRVPARANEAPFQCDRKARAAPDLASRGGSAPVHETPPRSRAVSRSCDRLQIESGVDHVEGHPDLTVSRALDDSPFQQQGHVLVHPLHVPT